VAKFVTIGYGDEEGYDRTAVAARDQAHADDARWRESGAEMGVAGSPVQVRNHDGAGRASAAPTRHDHLVFGRQSSLYAELRGRSPVEPPRHREIGG
jgi:hypothetical protein